MIEDRIIINTEYKHNPNYSGLDCRTHGVHHPPQHLADQTANQIANFNYQSQTNQIVFQSNLQTNKLKDGDIWEKSPSPVQSIQIKRAIRWMHANNHLCSMFFSQYKTFFRYCKPSFINPKLLEDQGISP